MLKIWKKNIDNFSFEISFQKNCLHCFWRILEFRQFDDISDGFSPSLKTNKFQNSHRFLWWIATNTYNLHPWTWCFFGQSTIYFYYSIIFRSNSAIILFWTFFPWWHIKWLPQNNLNCSFPEYIYLGVLFIYIFNFVKFYSRSL